MRISFTCCLDIDHKMEYNDLVPSYEDSIEELDPAELEDGLDDVDWPRPDHERYVSTFDTREEDAGLR